MGMRPSSDFDPDVKPGPTSRVEPGRAHVEIVNAEDKDPNSDKPYTQFELAVRAHDKPDQINRVHREKINWYHSNDWVQKQNQNGICLFALQAGVTTKEELKRKHEAGEELSFDWARAIGKHLIVRLEERPDKNDKAKHYTNIAPGEVYSPTDPRVADWPKDAKSLRLAEAADKF